MATENIPQIGRALKEWGQAFRKATEDINKGIKQMQNELNQIKESEGKTMKHNVTITKEESRVIEEYWCIRAVKKYIGEWNKEKKEVVSEKECDHEPTLQEIAQFLSETKADFVSVEHNYRFEPDLPFC